MINLTYIWKNSYTTCKKYKMNGRFCINIKLKYIPEFCRYILLGYPEEVQTC